MSDNKNPTPPPGSALPALQPRAPAPPVHSAPPSTLQAGSRRYLEDLLTQCVATEFPGSERLIELIQQALDEMPPDKDAGGAGGAGDVGANGTGGVRGPGANEKPHGATIASRQELPGSINPAE